MIIAAPISPFAATRFRSLEPARSDRCAEVIGETSRET
jgi:hypothetical protein